MRQRDPAFQLKEALIAATTALLIPRDLMMLADRKHLQALWDDKNVDRPGADRVLATECHRLAVMYQVPQIESHLQGVMSEYFCPEITAAK